MGKQSDLDTWAYLLAKSLHDQYPAIPATKIYLVALREKAQSSETKAQIYLEALCRVANESNISLETAEDVIGELIEDKLGPGEEN